VTGPANSARRRFICVVAGTTGALLAGWLPAHAEPAPADLPLELLGDDLTTLGPYVRIESDNRVVIGAPGCEVGQGVFTALPMLVAEELCVDWSQVTVVQLPYGYAQGSSGPIYRFGRQGGVPVNLAEDWQALREAGAHVRARLLAAAAREWGLPEAGLHCEAGEVIAPDGRRSTYGALAKSAASQPSPRDIASPVQPRDFRIVGTPTGTADAKAIVTGTARFGIDEYAADALVAVIARCPFPGGTLARYDDGAARRVAGVVDVISFAGPKPDTPFDGVLAAGVAVIGTTTWSALRGRQELDVEWTPAATPVESTGALARSAQALLDGSDPGLEVRSDGDTARARREGRLRVEARYQVPFLAHATMEPPGALLELDKDHARLVASIEDPDAASELISRMTGLPRGAIEIQLPRSGGSFGRRLRMDYVAEAVLLAKSAAKPVKLMWTREDDLAHDFYQPAGLHALSASLDRRKRITGWSHTCAAPPRTWRSTPLKGRPLHAGIIEPDAFPAGLVPNLDLRFHPLHSELPRDPAPGTHGAFQAFAVECFIDEIAIASQRDALELRLELLGQDLPHAQGPLDRLGRARLIDVLARCARRIGWGVPRTDGHGLGIACHAALGSFVAHGFEVSMEGDALVIHKAACVADVGSVVNPLGMEASLTGGTLASISDALHGVISTEDGRVKQKGFKDYPLLRMAESPRRMEVELVASDAAPSLAMHAIQPGAAPALANAIFAATTVRIRKLPMWPELMRMI